MMIATIKAWITAFRLRTLPLALSCVLSGSAISLLHISTDITAHHSFTISVFIAAICTTMLLQILSNLANDFGDASKGTDNDNRLGPIRAVQSGAISLHQMKIAVVVSSIVTFMSGISLLYLAFGYSKIGSALFFLLVGILAIIAAIYYTVGKSAYGYKAMGDLFVFVFFGWVGVLGVHYLQIQDVKWFYILPATTIGGLSAAVLNINNMRDIENDKQCGKITLANSMGLSNAKKYHVVLVVFSLCCMPLYIYFTKSTSLVIWLFVLVYPLFIMHLIKMYRINVNKDFNPLLPQLAMSTFLLSFIFFISACFV